MTWKFMLDEIASEFIPESASDPDQIYAMAQEIQRLRTQSFDIRLVREILSRLITRNESPPVRRASFRLGYLKNMKDLAERPEYHLAGAMDIITQYGPNYESGLQFGACVALCALPGTRGHSTLLRMLDEIKEQQDAEEKA